MKLFTIVCVVVLLVSEMKAGRVADGELEMNRVVNTKNGKDYIIQTLSTAEDNILHFKVKAPNDAYIALLTGPTFSNPMVEIILGSSSNMKSEIRRNQTRPGVVVAATPHVLDADEYRQFWIVWTSDGEGPITVYDSNLKELLTWEDQNPLNITHFGIGTRYGAPGTWNYYKTPLYEPRGGSHDGH